MSHITLDQLWFNLQTKLPYFLRREAVLKGTPSWWPLALAQSYKTWTQSPRNDPNYASIVNTFDALEMGLCRALTIASEYYPRLLRMIDEPPPILFYQGDLDLLSMPSLSVVGGRLCTASARAICRRWVPELTTHGIAIVSGLARGVDAEAHQAALLVNGNTVAVLAGGVGASVP